MKKHKPKRFLGKDTIDYSLVWETNETYEEDLAEWIALDGWDEDRPQKDYMRFHLIINGEEIGVYTDPTELTHFINQGMCYTKCYWYPNNETEQEVVYPDNKGTYSSFYPWTCSCGVAGCNGIFDGVHLKVRGRSVEWRVKKNMGYEFLDKTFYQFDKQDYFSMIERLKGEIKE